MACIFFFLTGIVFLPHLGIQNDEALFASAIYAPKGVLYSIRLFGAQVPLMLMSYLGTLKGWLYTVIFQFAIPGPASVRVPTLLMGMATIWLFYLLMRQLGDLRAAVGAAILLATDSVFLLTTTFDWGPVALQHLLLVAALLLLLRFDSTGSNLALAGGFFLLGLALWDKAIFSWLLVGLVAGALVAVPKEVIRAVTLARLAIAMAAFCLGCLPLVVYNIHSRLNTFRSNAHYSANDLPGKAHLLRITLNGSALLGWLSPEDDQVEHPAGPRGALERASFWLSQRSGHPRTSLGFHALCGALLLAPLVWWKDRKSGKLIVFSAVFMSITWLQMALTVGAGGAVHHTVLLWPFPQIVIATTLAVASRLMGRLGLPVLVAVVLLAGFTNFRVTNEYFAKVVRNGGTQNWTDAIFPLANYVRGRSAKFVFAVDWGIMDSLRLLDSGSLPLRLGCDPVLKPELSTADREYMQQWFLTPESIFVSHTPQLEFFQGVTGKLEKIGGEFGYRKEMIRVVADRLNRPTFEVFRFVR